MNWPSTWINQALTAAGIPVTSGTVAIMKAWKNSTPLQPYSNNPIGMPWGSSGSSRYAQTEYAQFGSMSAFYAAFKAWAPSHQGQVVIAAMTSDTPYPATWRAISELGWPGSRTETDYPAGILDLTESSYRASVKATDPPARKTSGMVGADPVIKATVIAHARSVADARKAFTDAATAVNHLIRRHGKDGY